uniref:FAD_binding_3 domain-containing protein n=1 Tax=Heterorhabditis bacteriophora TaxID=37862 RepID=A0A1I7XSD1_HETBA
MKKLKRRLSAAFRSGGSTQNLELCGGTTATHHINSGYSHGLAAVSNRTWSLSDSMNHLADRLAADGVIVEECDPSALIRRPLEHTYRHAPHPRTSSIYNPRIYSSYYGSHTC